MRLQKAIDGRLVTYHRCDTCWDIVDNDDYMGTEDNTMCLKCFNRMWNKEKKPVAATQPTKSHE